MDVNDNSEQNWLPDVNVSSETSPRFTTQLRFGDVIAILDTAQRARGFNFLNPSEPIDPYRELNIDPTFRKRTTLIADIIPGEGGQDRSAMVVDPIQYQIIKITNPNLPELFNNSLHFNPYSLEPLPKPEPLRLRAHISYESSSAPQDEIDLIVAPEYQSNDPQLTTVTQKVYDRTEGKPIYICEVFDPNRSTQEVNFDDFV